MNDNLNAWEQADALEVIGVTARLAKYRALTAAGTSPVLAAVEAAEHGARVMRRTLIEASSK